MGGKNYSIGLTSRSLGKARLQARTALENEVCIGQTQNLFEPIDQCGNGELIECHKFFSGGFFINGIDARPVGGGAAGQRDSCQGKKDQRDFYRPTTSMVCAT